MNEVKQSIFNYIIIAPRGPMEANIQDIHIAPGESPIKTYWENPYPGERNSNIKKGKGRADYSRGNPGQHEDRIITKRWDGAALGNTIRGLYSIM